MNRVNKNLILIVALCFAMFSGYSQNLKINELVARNSNGVLDEAGEDDDWIEIYNAGSTAFDLAGLYISDTNDISDSNPTGTFYRISESDASRTTVPAGGYLILWADGSPAQGPNHLNFKLGSNGEGVYLGQLDGGSISLIDQVLYPKLEKDVTYGRLPDGTGNFTLLSDPSPGAANLPLRVVGNVMINEIMAINTGSDRDENNEAEDWIEFYNPTTQAIDLGGVYLTDSVGELTMARIPITSSDSTTIPPGGFIRFWADAQPRTSILHLDFKLSGNGEKITFVQPDGKTIIQQARYPAQSSDASFGRLPDGSDNWAYLNTPTPNTANSHTYTAVEGIKINEILANNESVFPDNLGEIEDWIELYNSNSFAVNVGGLIVSDSIARPMAFRIPNTYPDSTTIPAYGYLVFWADNDPQQGVLHLDIKLSGSGEEIGLFQLRDDTYLIDSHVFGVQTPNVSIGRSPDGSANWNSLPVPTPMATNSGSGVHISELTDADVLVYPNPFEDELNIVIDVIEHGEVQWEILDIEGRIISSGAELCQSGRNKIILDQKTLAKMSVSGIYFLQLQIANFVVHKKIQKL